VIRIRLLNPSGFGDLLRKTTPFGKKMVKMKHDVDGLGW